METRWPASMGVTAPLRDLPVLSQAGQNQGGAIVDVVPPRNPYKVLKGEGSPAVLKQLASQILSEVPGPLLPSLTTTGLNFIGLGVGGGYTPAVVPPDPVGEVGDQYVQAVNLAFAVYDKSTGAKILGPLNTNLLFSGLPANDPCKTKQQRRPYRGLRPDREPLARDPVRE